MMHCNYTRVFLSSLMYETYCQFLPVFTVVLPVFPLSWQKYFTNPVYLHPNFLVYLFTGEFPGRSHKANH